MFRLLKLYLQLQKANLQARGTYSLNFVIGVIGVALSSLTSIILVWVVTRNVPEINGWNFYDITFCIAIWRTSHGLFIITFRQIRDLEYFLVEGTLDRFFVRPLNPIFQYATVYMTIAGFGDLSAGLGCLIFSIFHLPDWTLIKFFILIVVLICGAAINWAIETLICSTAFWTIKSGGLWRVYWVFMYNYTQYPLTVFNTFIQSVMSFVIPIAFIGFFPSQIFLGYKGDVPFSNYLVYLSPVIALIMVAVTYRVWKVGLNKYQGVGS